MPAIDAEPYDPWQVPFYARIDAALTPGGRVLDVGGGRAPTLKAHHLRDCDTYVGLDPSPSELERAPAGTYTQAVVGDITRRQRELEGSFDLVVSWQVLEHVRPLSAAISNMRAYLRPGGTMVSFFSGKFSAFGLVNTVLPTALGHRAVSRVMGRDIETVFAAYYDGCYPRALRRMLADWSSYEIVPAWGGAGYFRFMRPLQRLYVRYEEAVRRRHLDVLATHYLVAAVR